MRGLISDARQPAVCPDGLRLLRLRSRSRPFSPPLIIISLLIPNLEYIPAHHQMPKELSLPD